MFFFLQVKFNLQAELEGNPQKWQLPTGQVGPLFVLPHDMRKPWAKTELWLEVRGLRGPQKDSHLPLVAC